MHTNIVSLAFDGLSSNYVWAGTAEGDVLVFNTHVSRDRNHVCKRMATHAAPRGEGGGGSHCKTRTHCVICLLCVCSHTTPFSGASYHCCSSRWWRTQCACRCTRLRAQPCGWRCYHHQFHWYERHTMAWRGGDIDQLLTCLLHVQTWLPWDHATC